MIKKNHLPIFLGLIIGLSFTSCISKKKHLEAVQQLKLTHDSVFSEETNRLKKQINMAKDSIADLQLSLAERKGENNMLLLLRQELQQKIQSAELAIEDMNSSSQSNQQSLTSKLQEKNAEIARLKNFLKEIDANIDQHVTMLSLLSNDLNKALSGNDPQYFEITNTNHWVKVRLSEKMLFRSNSITKLNDQGLYVLEKLAEVFNRYPGMMVDVVGHTDNKKPDKSYKTNWNVSVLRAAIIVHTLQDEYDVSTSQIRASGKGEFAPISSNESSAGRAANRRVEFILSPGNTDLVKSIKAFIDKVEK